MTLLTSSLPQQDMHRTFLHSAWLVARQCLSAQTQTRLKSASKTVWRQIRMNLAVLSILSTNILDFLLTY